MGHKDDLICVIESLWGRPQLCECTVFFDYIELPDTLLLQIRVI